MMGQLRAWVYPALHRLGRRNFAGANLRGVDLSGADLSHANLRGADLRDARLHRAQLNGADLSYADLSYTDLSASDLTGAHLKHANLLVASLWGATLVGANLSRATLSPADLSHADLSRANLSHADLSDAELLHANLSLANLSDANLSAALLAGARFSAARLVSTRFVDVNLSVVDLSRDIQHVGPSSVSTDTLRRSKGCIPDTFLRGCGLADWEILNAKLYDPDLTPTQVADIQAEVFHLRAASPIQINSLFISYQHDDTSFVDAIEKKLDSKGIRFWRDVHDMKAGPMEKQIHRAIISLNEVVLLVLSENSVKSDWVESEARRAREKEQQTGKHVLCPIALDDAWTRSHWPQWLRDQIENYHILDFSDWKDPAVLDRQFKKLVDGLGLFYTGERDPATPTGANNDS